MAQGRERTVLAGLVLGKTPRFVAEEHLDELERLVETAGGVVVARSLQERATPDVATLVGSGFAEGLAGSVQEHEAQTIVFDEDLTGSQIRNLEKIMPEGVKVLDRAAVILDIFAQRARSREAQTQVELAQLSYLLPRLTRRWRHLSRQAGGIGTRGVGETQLEIDRRLISQRIAQLKDKLGTIERDRRLRRQRRSQVASLALVGYTNAGKSSLLRALTHAETLVEDRLFATLDPRARRMALGDGMAAVLIDTVGFIRKLPHDLVAPFRSTLEEAVESDLVLHVVDVSHPQWEEHLAVGDEVLESLGVARERTVVVGNKIDRLPHGDGGRPRDAVRVSAHTGEGLEELRRYLRGRLLATGDVAVLRVPLADAAAVERALQLPNRIAERYRAEILDLAVRTDGAGLKDSDLLRYRVDEWPEPAVEPGG